jgi:hypothetical protein
MNLNDIENNDVLNGKVWVIKTGSEGESNPEIREAISFLNEDIGLFSAVVKIADGSEHLGVVVKSFPQGGDDIDIYIKTNFGWLNTHAAGFMRALGKYSHEIFPFDYFLASPWKGGKTPEPDKTSSHPKIFRDTAVRIRKTPSVIKKN